MFLAFFSRLLSLLFCLFLTLETTGVGGVGMVLVEWVGGRGRERGGGGGTVQRTGKKTIFSCLWLKASCSRQQGLQHLAGGTVAESQPPLYPCGTNLEHLLSALLHFFILSLQLFFLFSFFFCSLPSLFFEAALPLNDSKMCQRNLK